MENVVLIVDDMPINIELLSNILCDEYEILTAPGGAEALETLKSQKPDLVLLDLMMPGIDGFGVMKSMKDNPDINTIPVIFVTGAEDQVMEEQGIELGAVDYIRKPFNPLVVRAKVRNHVLIKSYRDGLETLVGERTKALKESAAKLQERTEQLASSREAIIMGMSLMSEMHDRVTGNHITRIKYYTKRLAEKLAESRPDLLPREDITDIVLFSPMHDLGKVSIPDSILHKTGVLTEEEMQVMRMHTLDGGEILRKTGSFLSGSKGDDLRVAIEIAEGHHERFDGTGYPKGLKGDDIPISARIVSPVDVYDALRSVRPYKKSFTHEEAMNILLKGDRYTKPEHFDPKIMEEFAKIEGDLDNIFTKSLENSDVYNN